MTSSAGPSADPRDSYRTHLEARRAEHQRHQRRDRTFSVLRVLCFVLAVVAGLWQGSGAFLAGMGVFVALVVAHARVVKAGERAARRAAYHEAGLARLDDQWAGRGEPGTSYADPSHPYAVDLDLFGPGSVFERLCAARTRSGQDTLASWLLAPAPADVVAERQAAVGELRPRIDLREDLAVLGAEARGGVDSRALRAWLERPPVVVPAALTWTAAAVSAFALVALTLWLAGGWGSGPFALAVLAAGALAAYGRRWTSSILEGVDRPARDLATVSELLARLEAERFAAPLLARLRSAFAEGGARPSRLAARLRLLVELHDSRGNLAFAPLAFLLLWDVQIAAAIERWRRRAGPALAGALRATGEMEALSSLAGYAFECPQDPFAELVPDGPLLHADGVAHPLLPAARAVRNDVHLDAGRALLVVSGSNMSGKSTLLRTLGVNAVLAQAGAPVRARALRVSPLAVGASIRVLDSLQEGRSRFYAEIKRVRQVMDLAGGRPWLLFLLDEIFQGTNSADRRVGAEAVMRALIQRSAIGLVTSHDLALADVADSLAPRAANVHFEDHLEGDAIAFDYVLKPGRVRTSNALALMRAVGLEV